MKTFFAVALTLVTFLSAGFAEPRASVKGRILTELPGLPENVLQRAIAPWFYKSLVASPLEGWIVTRGLLSNTKVYGARIVRSDLNGIFDARVLQAASELEISGDYRLDRLAKTSPVLMQTLVYKIADGTMLVSFAFLDRPEGTQMYYIGCARLDVLEKDGRWVKLNGGGILEGKGLTMYSPGSDNSLISLTRLYGLNFHGSR